MAVTLALGVEAWIIRNMSANDNESVSSGQPNPVAYAVSYSVRSVDQAIMLSLPERNHASATLQMLGFRSVAGPCSALCKHEVTSVLADIVWCT